MLPLLLLGALLTGAPANAPDALLFRKAAGVPVRVIQVNLADPRVKLTVQTANGFPNSAERFETLLARSNPTIAINGTYFSKSTMEPIGSIVVGGQCVYEGFMGTALAITRDNQAVIRRVNRGHTEDWSSFETVLSCGPALVLGGNIDVQAREEGFHDPHIMGSARRMGLGLTADRHMLLVNTLAPVTFLQWAEVMKALGCTDAMNLDAGASLAMYYRGKTLLHPGRPLTNLFLVYVDSSPPDTSRRLTRAVSRSQTSASARAPLGPTVPMRLCADSRQRATRWCPVTFIGRVGKREKRGYCPLHHAPPGE